MHMNLVKVRVRFANHQPHCHPGISRSSDRAWLRQLEIGWDAVDGQQYLLFLTVPYLHSTAHC